MADNFVQITLPQNRFSSLKSFLQSFPNKAVEAVREATLYTEALIKKDFMSVSDGSLVRIIKSGRSAGVRVMTKRTVEPGVRASTGNLRRNTRSAFRYNNGSFEGAIGTDIFYGVYLERNPKYEFLKPGLEKAMPEIRALIDRRIKGIVG